MTDDTQQEVETDVLEKEGEESDEVCESDGDQKETEVNVKDEL